MESVKVGITSVLGILLLTSIGAAQAQTTIKGSLIDSKENPVPFAYVLLLSAGDSSLVKGTVTDNAGYYSFNNIKPGQYVINVSYIGYSKFNSEVFAVSAEQLEVVQSPIRLAEDNVMLEGVTVSGARDIYQKQVDRTIINVQNSVTAAGGTALEILEKSPGLVVNRQTGTISMNGKTGVLIMLDGKVSNLPLDVIVQMLGGMSSSNIEKIELLPNPSSKYDAQGDGGIINIITINKPDQGTYGKLEATLGYNGGAIGGASADLSHKRAAMEVFASYGVRYDANYPEWISRRLFEKNDFIQTNSSVNLRDAVAVVQNARLGMSLKIAKNTTLDLLATGYKRRWDTNDEIRTVNTQSTDSTIFTTGVASEIDELESVTGSFSVSHRFNKSNSLLSMEYDYLFYQKVQPSVFDNASTITGTTVSENIKTRVQAGTPIIFNVLKFDYTKDLGAKLRVDFGAKGSISNFENTINVTRTTGGVTVLDPILSRVTKLREEIRAIYTLFKLSPQKNWNLSSGVRYEHTDSFLSDEVGNILVNREFGSFFPSVTFDYKFSDSSSFNVAYSRRISRPTFNNLAPSVFFINPTTLLTGNVFLRPAFSTNLDLGAGYRGWWAAVQYSYSENAIVPFQPETDPTTEQLILRPQNLNFMRKCSFTLTAPLYLAKWWEIKSNFLVSFDRIKSMHLQNNVDNSLTSYAYSGINSIYLAKDFTMEITGNFFSTSLLGVTQIRAYGRLDVGLKKKFIHGTLSLVGTDLLGTTPIRRVSEIPSENINVYLYYDFKIRSILVTYSWAFGNSKMKSTKSKLGAEEEKKRAQ
jgi:hypothetical protein